MPANLLIIQSFFSSDFAIFMVQYFYTQVHFHDKYT